MSIARQIFTFFQRLNRSTAWPGQPTSGLLVVVTLGLISGAVACSLTAASAPSAPAQAYTFYRFNPLAENMLVSLDPQTLDDRAHNPPLEPGRFSVGGSTRVDVEYPPGRGLNNPGPHLDQVWIVIRDLQTGAERSRFHPPVNGLVPVISADGTRLVVKPFPPGRYYPTAEWYVVDANTGQPLVHIHDVDTSCFRGGAGLFDPAVQKRVYCPVELAITEARGPEALRIVAYDLKSAAKAGEVELPEVLTGGWRTGQTVDNQPVWAFLEPAVVLSPDGQQLAVVHADADLVTLIEAESLTVERTMALKQPTSLWDWFAPRIAQAKGASEGTFRHAVFSPDGGYLYVFSQEIRVSSDEAPDRRGLRLVDLTQGHVMAEALPEYQIQWVQPAPDGSVYVFGTTDHSLGASEIRPTSPSMLWRLDALTLEILVQRAFTGYQGGRLVPEESSE